MLMHGSPLLPITHRAARRNGGIDAITDTLAGHARHMWNRLRRCGRPHALDTGSRDRRCVRADCCTQGSGDNDRDRRPDGYQSQRATAAKVRRSVDRAEQMIDALLTLADSNQGVRTQEFVDLATAAEDALENAATRIGDMDLAVTADLQPARGHRRSRALGAHDREARRQRRAPQCPRWLDPVALGGLRRTSLPRSRQQRSLLAR